MRHLLASAAMPPAPEEAQSPGQGEKLYVTRSGLPSQLGRLMGDVVLDPLLQAIGYTVFHPEQTSLAEQIHRYSRARDLIFMDGSSLYVLWFAKLRRGTRVRVILRRRQGRWVCEKVRELLPNGHRIRWQVLDGLRSEALTSDKDWESQNVADLRILLRQLGGAAPAALPDAAAAALACYADTFVEQSTPEQLSRVVEALIAALADGRIQAVAVHHQALDAEEQLLPLDQRRPGLAGHGQVLPQLWQALVVELGWPAQQLWQALCWGPAAFLGMDPPRLQTASRRWILFDPTAPAGAHPGGSPSLAANRPARIGRDQGALVGSGLRGPGGWWAPDFPRC